MQLMHQDDVDEWRHEHPKQKPWRNIEEEINIKFIFLMNIINCSVFHSRIVTKMKAFLKEQKQNIIYIPREYY